MNRRIRINGGRVKKSFRAILVILLFACSVYGESEAIQLTPADCKAQGINVKSIFANPSSIQFFVLVPQQNGLIVPMSREDFVLEGDLQLYDGKKPVASCAIKDTKPRKDIFSKTQLTGTNFLQFQFAIATNLLASSKFSLTYTHEQMPSFLAYTISLKDFAPSESEPMQTGISTKPVIPSAK